MVENMADWCEVKTMDRWDTIHEDLERYGMFSGNGQGRKMLRVNSQSN